MSKAESSRTIVFPYDFKPTEEAGSFMYSHCLDLTVDGDGRQVYGKDPEDQPEGLDPVLKEREAAPGTHYEYVNSGNNLFTVTSRDKFPGDLEISINYEKDRRSFVFSDGDRVETYLLRPSGAFLVAQCWETKDGGRSDTFRPIDLSGGAIIRTVMKDLQPTSLSLDD